MSADKRNINEIYPAGCAPGVFRGADGQTLFRVWAPRAAAVSLVGDFLEWEKGVPCRREPDGMFSVTLPTGEVPCGGLYKFRIVTPDGRVLYKADPFARATEPPPGTASRIFDSVHVWQDSGWLSHRRRTVSAEKIYSRPLHIYELHALSWKRNPDGSPLSWRELAAELVPYVKMMGFTHVELLPVTEHPYDGSWGYQSCGYFAPTARLGSPDDFRFFMDTLHGAGVGVILDFLPGHFPKDAHGLYEFDGQPLYEYADPCRRENRGWGTRCFDLGKPEVADFLLAAALWWVEEYHADGLRIDAVSAMLYLDFDRAPGEWSPGPGGDNRNRDAIAFLTRLNRVLHAAHPDVLTVAEESSAYPGVTAPAESGGLGFSLKWNMGWMNDTLSLAETDPLFRSCHHDKLTFPLTYAFSERYVLPVSHDEVVHGKRSFLDKMPGSYEEKFAGERLFYAWQTVHPGKKLTFMGSEIGQFREWDYAGSVEWFLLDYPAHREMQRYFADLNHFYLSHPALWKNEAGWDGFSWIDPDNRAESVLSLIRRDGKERDDLYVLLNFTPVPRPGFRLGAPEEGTFTEVFNSNAVLYGGSGAGNGTPVSAFPCPVGSMPCSAPVFLPGLSALFFRFRPARKGTPDGKKKRTPAYKPGKKKEAEL